MKIKSEKLPTPPLVSFVSYLRFLNQLRDVGSVPTQIDKTLMPKFSGSQISAMLAAMKYLGQIDENNKPQDSFKELVLAKDEARTSLFAALLRARYSFLFDDATFDMQNASSGEMEKKFKSLNITGSTVTKTIAFFLSAAKAADIQISTHVKVPPPPRTLLNAKKANKKGEQMLAPNVDKERETLPESASDVERFEIPIPGKSSVRVIVPKDFDSDDWEMLQLMLSAYITRWKGFKK